MPRPRHHQNGHQAAEALVRTAPLVSRWIERLLAGHEPPLTVAQYLALQAVGEGEVVGSELARRTAVAPAATAAPAETRPPPATSLTATSSARARNSNGVSSGAVSALSMRRFAGTSLTDGLAPSTLRTISAFRAGDSASGESQHE